MIREINRCPAFLSIKSEAATAEDKSIADDLADTILFNREKCVGMAANMIGESKRIIIFDNNGKYFVMFNPVIIDKHDQYQTEEGCLSLPGKRNVTRYKKIKVEFQNEKMQKRVQTFSGWTAQIIQHEIDHCNGILI